MVATETRLKRGSYAGRWEVYDGDLHIGWVVRHSDGGWNAYVAAPYGVRGYQVGRNESTRRDAVSEVVINREVWGPRP